MKNASVALRALLFVVPAVLCIPGCVEHSSPPTSQPHITPPPEPPSPPAPSRLKGDAEVIINLPPELAAQLHVPPKLKTTVQVTGEAHQISPSPRQSTWEYQVKLAITDFDGRQTFASAQSTLAGESSSRPGDALVEGGRQMLEWMLATIEAQGAIARPIAPATTQPAGGPATRPGALGLEVIRLKFSASSLEFGGSALEGGSMHKSSSEDCGK